MHYLEVLKKDKILEKLILVYEIPVLEKRSNIYLQLIRSIISQQLSVHVAKIIFERFLQLFPKEFPTLQDIKNMSVQDFRNIGLSHQKANYILNIVHFFEEHQLKDIDFDKMASEDILNLLIQIKGVGKWTIEMILIFALCKENIFSVDDLGIQNAMKSLYKIKDTEKKKIKEKMQKISQKWSPYQSYACLYLWQWANQQSNKNK